MTPAVVAQSSEAMVLGSIILIYIIIFLDLMINTKSIFTTAFSTIFNIVLVTLIVII